MKTFISALKELWSFILDEFFVTFKQVSTPVATLALPALKLDSGSSSLPQSTNESDIDIHKPKQINTYDAVISQAEQAYVAVDDANIFMRPVFTYDGVIGKLAYSSPIHVLGYEGRFARMTLNDKTGWVLKDEITSNKEDIFPELQLAEIYSVNHPDTKKIRKLIVDEFFAEELFLPLQAVEFVSYRLKQAKHEINWPPIRPREPGNWQNILKGRLGIQIGISPKAGSVIEFTKADGSGFLGYTKSVYVDETIIIESVGKVIEGEYRQDLLTKTEWQEWRPIWITIS